MPQEVLRWLKEKLEEELDSCLTTKYPILDIEVNVGIDDNYIKSTIIKGWQNCRPEFRKMAIKYELGKITKPIQFHKEHSIQSKALSNADYYSTRLQDYLIANNTSLPEYNETTGDATQIYPDQSNQYFTGIQL